MGKTKPPPDFRKVKNKVGKTKKVPRNETRIDFKATRIYMPKQHAIASKTISSTWRNMNLTDILGHIKHHNANVRASAFTQMRELFADSNGLLQMHLGHVVEATSLSALDPTPQVRKEYRTFLRWLLAEVAVDLQSFYPFLHLQIKASLTHVDPHVRKEGLVLLELFLAHPEGPRIVRGCSRIVELLVQIGANTSPVDARLLRILRQVLSFDDEGETTKSNDVSIRDVLASGKKTNGNTNTAALAELALRTYMEAGDDIDGLQLKLNACALLEKVENPPWDVMAKRLFGDFPISAHCPPNTNRAVHSALVSSVNLHLASLIASSPQHPSASSSPLPYLETITRKLKASGASIDDEECVAVQSVAAKVTRIVDILRREVGHNGADAAIARIIGQLCLPKNAAELKSAHVLLMIPFVDDMRDVFDRDTVTSWIQVWPKVLWSSEHARSKLLPRILSLARSSTVLFEEIQRFLLPFYIGIADAPAPLLRCSASDQAIAVSILFYLQGNWNTLLPKVAPLLKSSLDQHAKDLLLDVLLVKDVETSTKLRLLLSMLLQDDESWRKVASFTISVDNYWTTLAYPLAQRARAVDRSSRWLEYMFACAQPTDTQVLAHLLQCVAVCPDGLISALVAALYHSATCSVSDVYEAACKQCFVANNVRVLEALILDKRHHCISTDSWGGTTFLNDHLAKATVSELREQLASWDLPLLPML